MKKQDLEQRLINFSVKVIEIVKRMPKTVPEESLAKQLGRSSTSVSLNYGEAQSAESRKDFVHKIKIVLKELRETHICLRIIKNAKLLITETSMDNLISENNELIAIFVKSVATAQNRGK